MINKKNKKLELLAPAGNLEKMKTAFAYGADAVYLGIPDFSLRVRINDFDLAGIKKAVELAHKQNKKVYVTVNIFAHNEHIKKLPAYIKKLKTFKIDALIASDPGVIQIIKKFWPKAEIHLSTQANCTNAEAAKFWKSQGVKRIILGREVTLKEIKEIKKQVPGIELEYFVHGAMCMAYSGRCFLSKYFLDRSANLGDCGQPCRWSYKVHKVKSQKSLFISEEKRLDMPLEVVEEEHGSYILNSKDLCLIKYLDKLVEAGVTSFKIEGRAKSAYYLATVVGGYREVLDNPSTSSGQAVNRIFKDFKDKLIHRGYTTGFLLGEKADQNISKSHEKSDWEFCGQVIEAAHCNAPEQTQIIVKVHNTIKAGDIIEIIKPPYDIIKYKVKKIVDHKTGEEISEAHGGGSGHIIELEVSGEIPEHSVIRRLIK